MFNTKLYNQFQKPERRVKNHHTLHLNSSTLQAYLMDHGEESTPAYEMKIMKKQEYIRTTCVGSDIIFLYTMTSKII